MSDSAQIFSLFNVPSNDRQFRDRQLQYLTPVGGKNVPGQYSVKFSTKPINKKWISLADSWLSLPITLTGDGGNFMFDEPFVAAKQCLLSLISQVRVHRVDGGEILNVDDIHITSNLELLMNSNPEMISILADQIQFAKDRRHEDSVGAALTTTAHIEHPRSNYFTATPTKLANNSNHDFNVGFAERRKSLLSSCVKQDGTGVSYAKAGITFTAKIPLSIIHGLFAQLDFPLYNPNIQIEFILHTRGGNSGYSPFCSGKVPAADVDIDERSSVCTLTTTGESECRLYYHELRLDPMSEAKAVEMVNKGFERKLTFLRSHVREAKAAKDASINADIMNDSVAARRVWAWCLPQGKYTGATWPNPLVTGARGLTNLNVRIRNHLFFQTNLDTLEEQYDHLMSVMPKHNGTGAGPLTFSDFAGRFRLHCLDVSRVQDLVDKDASSVIRIEGRVVAPDACDIIYVIQEEKSIVLQFDGSGIKKVID